MGENIFSGIIDDVKWRLASEVMKRYGIFFDGVRNGNKVDLTISTQTTIIELAGRKEPGDGKTTSDDSNIFSGAVEDSTWLMMIRFMEKYGVFFNGVRDGNRVDLVISTPKDTFRLVGRMTPRSDPRARIGQLLADIMK